jgi:hypothetical protein
MQMSGSTTFLKAIKDLGNKYPHVRSQAVISIGTMFVQQGLNAHTEEIHIAARCLAEHVTDADEQTAVNTCDCLVLLGANAAGTLPQMAYACRDKRQAVGLAAANALLKLAKGDAATRRKAADVLPILVEGLMEIHPEVIGPVANLFRLAGAEAGPAVEQLVDEHLLAEPQGTVEKLREKVTGQYHKRRQRAFELLNKMGPAGAPALPALKEFLKSEDPWAQQQAKSCIIRIRQSSTA